MSKTTKIGISSILFLTIVVGAIAIIGSKKDRFSTTLLIKATPSEIFPYLREHELRKKWNPNIVEIRSSASGANEVGMTGQTVMDEDGRHVDYETTVIRYEENSKLSIQHKHSTRLLTSVFHLDDKEDGTTSFTCRLRTANRGMGLLTAVFTRRDWKDEVVENTRRLKEIVESASSNRSTTEAKSIQ